MRTILLLLFFQLSFPTIHAQRNSLPKIGVVQAIENDSLLHTSGYQFLVESTTKLLSPRTVTDDQFAARLAMLKSARIPVYACNLFLPSDLKVVGPTVDQASVLVYVETVFQRARRAGLSVIIWGSGGSRRIPEGFDRANAKEQFISIAKRIATVAAKYKIVLAMENLNSSEANFITTLGEAVEIARAVNHKNFRLCADIYHMLKEDEAPSMIENAKEYLVYCELAEEEGRTPPGVHGENFLPYFSALKKIGYKGRIAIECSWGDIRKQGPIAFDEVKRQLLNAYQ